MTDDKPAAIEGNVDLTIPKSGIHIGFPAALVASFLVSASMLFTHCSSNSASASPDVAAKLDKLSSDINEIKTNTKDLSNKVDDLKDDVQLLKIQLLQDKK